MRIRDGGSPRGAQTDQAHPAGESPEKRETRTQNGSVEDRLTAQRRARIAARAAANGRPDPPRHGFLRFLAFALVLAVFVLAGLALVARPIVTSVIVGWAADNPTALGLPFVADIVRSDLGSDLTTAPSADSTQVDFVVEPGDTVETIAARLASSGFLLDRRAFVFDAIERGVATSFKAGTFQLRKNMAPDEIVTALVSPPPVRTVTITFREGLRIEQIVALLQTKPLTMDVHAFYDLAEHPTPELLGHYPWLKLPQGASLEGFLAPATYEMLPDITPEGLLRKMLDHFYETVGPDRLNVAASRGMTFYQVLSLASIVELEDKVDSERPLIAGVYQNRLTRKMLLNADPTLAYANDTVALRTLPFEQWPQYVFWNVVKGALASFKVPADLAGYQTYQHVGLIPGPICTPTVASIDAALNPNTKTGYLYFVAKNDGSGTHAFAKTLAEQVANQRKYGYAP